MRYQRYIGIFLVPCMFQPSIFAQVTSLPTTSTVTHRPLKAHNKRDDIESIGARNIGKTGFGNWYSLEKEIAMGRRYSQELEGNVKLLRDPVIIDYVNSLAQKLVRNSDAKVPFTVRVLDSQEVNAYALPGGFLYVNSNLIIAADNEAELASIMAHEIAHVAARHATRQMTRSHLLTIASVPSIFLGGGAGLAIELAARVARPLSLTTFSRRFEEEADYLGIEYLYKAGYDPHAFISFFERIDEQQTKSGVMTKLLSDHPQTADRIRKTQREIANILPSREEYVISTSEFDTIRARLISAENALRLRDRGDRRPTLRRRPETADIQPPDND